jgi:hypothetical protein
MYMIIPNSQVKFINFVGCTQCSCIDLAASYEFASSYKLINKMIYHYVTGIYGGILSLKPLKSRDYLLEHCMIYRKITVSRNINTLIYRYTQTDKLYDCIMLELNDATIGIYNSLLYGVRLRKYCIWLRDNSKNCTKYRWSCVV